VSSAKLFTDLVNESVAHQQSVHRRDDLYSTVGLVDQIAYTGEGRADADLCGLPRSLFMSAATGPAITNPGGSRTTDQRRRVQAPPTGRHFVASACDHAPTHDRFVAQDRVHGFAANRSLRNVISGSPARFTDKLAAMWCRGPLQRSVAVSH
jgi:hypothetical protein